MRTFLKSFIWIVPFLSFLAGYQMLRFLTHTEVIEVPPVVGLHMHDAIKTLSAFQLNVRILAEKEDPDMSEGIIMSQMPLAGQKVKPHQSIFLVITRKPPRSQAPSLYGISQEEAVAQAQELGIQLKIYPLESIHPTGTVIAQNLLRKQEVPNKLMTAAVSSGLPNMRIFPNLHGYTVEQATEFFKDLGIKVEVAHTKGQEMDHVCTKCTVVEQRPRAATFIDLKRPPTVSITVIEAA